jgi:hypothetical protein
MSLLNVRLSEDDANLVRELRRRGVSISEVVRGAIRARAAEAVVPEDTDAILEEVFRRFPAVGSRHAVDTTDRRALQRFIRRRLAKRRP